MFEERFTLVGEFSNICFRFFRLCLSPSHIPSAILMWSNVTVMRKYAFPVGTNNIFIQVKTGDPGFTQWLQGSVS